MSSHNAATADRLETRKATRVWVVLLLLTAAAALAAKVGLQGAGLAFLLLATVFLKGQLVADHFMGLRRTRVLWRAIVFGYLLVLVLGIGIAYRLALT